MLMLTQDKRQPAFNDNDLMPFGKHEGEPLQDVPARYLAWLWASFEPEYRRGRELRPADPEWLKVKQKLANYIWNSREAIEQETGEML